MLAGERFSDRPKAVCPSIAALLRAYNDNIDEKRRSDLYRYAAEGVGTRRDHLVQEKRSKVALSFARPGYARRGWLHRLLRKPPEEPQCNDGPDEIAFYVLGSLEREGIGWLRRSGWWSNEDHKLYLWLLDRLIEMGVDTSSRSWLLSRLAENVQAAAEPAPAAADEPRATELALAA